MGIAELDRRVQAAQVVAIGSRDVGLLQRVQDRLVAFVDQHRDPLPGPAMKRPDQVAESLRPGVVTRLHSGIFPDGVELRHQVRVQVARLLEIPAGEVEPHDRTAH